MLNECVFPRLRNRPDFNNLLFMQDSASPHYAKKVRDLLDALPAGLIGHSWPRPCDLTPMDFSIWGMMKDKVFRGKPRTLSQLQAFIKSEFKQINGNKVLSRKIL